MKKRPILALLLLSTVVFLLCLSADKARSQVGDVLQWPLVMEKETVIDTSGTSEKVYVNLYFNPKQESNGATHGGQATLDLYFSTFVADSLDSILVDVWGIKRKKREDNVTVTVAGDTLTTMEFLYGDSTRIDTLSSKATLYSIALTDYLAKNYDGIRVGLANSGSDTDSSYVWRNLSIRVNNE